MPGALRGPERDRAISDGRIRHWTYVAERGKYLRVVTLADGETVLTAFLDRGFTETEPVRFHYHPDTDSLYIDLADRPGVDSREVASDVIIDLDAERRVVGIEIHHARALVDLSRLDAESLP